MKRSELTDPLLVVRKLMWLYIWLGLPITILAVVTADDRSKSFELCTGLARAMLLLAVIYAVLPSRRSDFLYLRSFGQDKRNDAIRRVMEVSIAPLRLSGIRDPNRRIPAILKPLLEGLLVWVYASNRRMNLESNSDWRTRLAISLAKVRGVVVDYRSPSPSILHEMGICIRQLTPERILLLVHPGQVEKDEFRSAIPDGIRTVIITEDASDLGELARRMTGFVTALPDTKQVPCADAFDFALAASERSPQAVERESLRESLLYGLGWVLAIALAISLEFGVSDQGVLRYFLAISLIFAVWAPGSWFLEHRRRVAVWHNLGLASPKPSLSAAILLFPVAWALILGSLSLTVFTVVHDYNLRGEFTKAESLGDIAKTVYAEFYASNNRAPRTAELVAELKNGGIGADSGPEDPTLQFEITESKNIRVTILKSQAHQLTGHSFQFIASILPSGDLSWSCIADPGFPKEAVPRTCRNDGP